MRSVLSWIFVVFLALGAVLRSENCFAQAEKADGGTTTTVSNDALYEFGAHLGNLLPNQIDGVSEILGLGGARAGVRLSPGTYAEGGLILGNGDGVHWKNIHTDLRMDVPIENIVGLAFVGADAIYYKGANTSKDKLLFGGHVGGGVRVHVSGTMWFRTDMKFGFSPGTSLYFGFGFEWRLGGASSGGS
jgi:hypothetical protein